MTSAALFDLDGTLVHLPVAIEERRADVAALFFARGWRGEMRPILSAIDAAAAAVAPTADERASLIAEARGILDRAEIEAVSRSTILTGAADLVGAIAATGAAIGVVTNNCAASARRALERFDLAGSVGAVVGRDEVARPKPDPAGLASALDRLGDPGRAMWIGDSRGDVEAGLGLRLVRPSLELRVIGLGTDRERARELAGAGADVVVAELAGIEIDWLR